MKTLLAAVVLGLGLAEGTQQENVCKEILGGVTSLDVHGEAQEMVVPLDISWSEDSGKLRHAGVEYSLSSQDNACRIVADVFEAYVKPVDTESETLVHATGKLKTADTSCTLAATRGSGTFIATVSCSSSTWHISGREHAEIRLEEMRRYLPVTAMILFLVVRYIWKA